MRHNGSGHGRSPGVAKANTASHGVKDRRVTSLSRGLSTLAKPSGRAFDGCMTAGMTQLRGRNSDAGRFILP
jgi:hypothetical protein